MYILVYSQYRPWYTRLACITVGWTNGQGSLPGRYTFEYRRTNAMSGKGYMMYPVCNMKKKTRGRDYQSYYYIGIKSSSFLAFIQHVVLVDGTDRYMYKADDGARHRKAWRAEALSKIPVLKRAVVAGPACETLEEATSPPTLSTCPLSCHFAVALPPVNHTHPAPARQSPRDILQRVRVWETPTAFEGQKL